LAAYNEGRALGDVLNGIARAFADGGVRVWVVDDGSTDDTATVAREWVARLPVELLRHEQNRGLGAALHTGFSALLPRIQSDDVVVTLDADNTHSPAQIPALVQPIVEGRADLAIASRFVFGARVVGVPWHRVWLSRGAMFLFRWIVPLPGVRDYTCGFRAFRGSLLIRAAARWGRLATESGFAASAEILVKAGALEPRVQEIPLILRYDRKPGASKMRVGMTILRNLAVMSHLRKLRGL
jgi:dolichol-phosphate mannosyltransferase